MNDERPSLREIEVRHGRDRWKDGGLIALAVLVTSFTIAAFTSKANGKPSTHVPQGHVTVVYGDLEIQR
jgi:hypothetical protein